MAEHKDGLPSTDFSRMNREWVKAVADAAAGEGGGNTDQYPGWDAVIKITVTRVEDEPVYTAFYEKGSFQTIIDSHSIHPVQALFYIVDSDSNTCTPFIMGGIENIADDQFSLMNIITFEQYNVFGDNTVEYNIS